MEEGCKALRFSDRFWNRRVCEFLPSLQTRDLERTSWRKPKDRVLIVNESFTYDLAIYPRKNGVTRIVGVATAGVTLLEKAGCLLQHFFVIIINK